MAEYAAGNDGRMLYGAQNDLDVHALDARDRHIQRFVFISIRERFDKPQGVLSRALPSLIWLQTLNQCARVCGDALKGIRREYSLRRLGRDGELSMGARRMPVGEHKLPDDMVETGSHVVDAITKDYGETE